MRDAGLRLVENVRKTVEFLGIDVAVEFASKEKLKLQSIHFAARNPSDTSIILIVKINIITIFGGKKNTGDKKAMDGSGINEHRTLIPNYAIKVNKSNDETLHSAWSIRNDPFDILTDRYAGGPRGMETRPLGRRVPTLMASEFLKSSGKGRNEHLDSGIGKSLHLHLY